MSGEADDRLRVLRLDQTWNDAYLRHDRSLLAGVLADDFQALAVNGDVVTKAALMADPPGRALEVKFTEQAVMLFGDTAIATGRLQLTLPDREADQRFLRVYAKRDGQWRAVSVAVTPLS